MEFKRVSFDELSSLQGLEILTRLNAPERDIPWSATCVSFNDSSVALGISLAFEFSFQRPARHFLHKTAQRFIERMSDSDIGRLIRAELLRGNRPELYELTSSHFRLMLTSDLASEAMNVLSEGINTDSVQRTDDD